jgi:hypothetical protein
MAGRYYLEQQGKSPGVPESELIRVAVQSLGLAELAPFDPRKKIIELQMEDGTGGRLAAMPVRAFADELSTESPAPGGGSVARSWARSPPGFHAAVANRPWARRARGRLGGDALGGGRGPGAKDFFSPQWTATPSLRCLTARLPAEARAEGGATEAIQATTKAARVS